MFRGFSIRGYIFEELIGAGGMGEIWAAKRSALGDRVAIKVLKVSAAQNTEAAKAELLKEARATSLIQHPNVCKVFDFFEEGDTCYLVMELLQGMDLGRFIKLHRQLPDQDRYQLGLYITKMILRALASAHHIETFESHRILHRDIKPSNIYLTIHGEVKLLDLGIAKMESDFDTTRSTHYAYTEAYSSPDLWENGIYRGERYSTDNDLYSLGLVFMELVAGDKARRDAECLTPEIRTVLEHWLAEKKEARYSESRELLKLIEDECTRLHVSESVLLKYISSSPAAHETVKAPARAPEKKKAFPKVAILTLGVALLLVGVAAYFLRPKSVPEKVTTQTQTTPVQNGIADIEYREEDFTYDADPRFMLTLPANGWHVKLGPIEDSKYDKELFTCGTSAIGETCHYFIPGTSNILQVFEKDGKVVRAILTFNGRKASAMLNQVTLNQLEEKKFKKDPVGVYESKNEQVQLSCGRDLCMVTVAPKVHYQTQTQAAPQPVNKVSPKKEVPKVRTSFTFTINHPAVAGLVFGLGNEYLPALKKSRLTCDEEFGECFGKTANKLATVNDFAVSAFYSGETIFKITIIHRSKNFQERHLKLVQTIPGFAEDGRSASLMKYRSKNELITFTQMDHPKDGTSYSMALEIPEFLFQN